MPRILKNMQDRFSKAQTSNKRASAGQATDTLKAFKEVVGQNADEITVGAGVALPVPAGKTAKQFLATVRGRGVAVTREGQPYAGRSFTYTVEKEGDKEFVLVMRNADGKALPRKTGGRPTNAVLAERAAAKAKEGNGAANGSTAGATPPAAVVKDLTKPKGGATGATA